MNPTVARGGSSFKGAFLYYMHDKGAATRERIAWAHSVNMVTSDPDKAWKVMAYTAKNQERLKMASGQNMSGRKTEKPVLAYSLSWHPEQTPSPDHMRETALQSLRVLGLEGHEAIVIAHSDTPHRHVHVVANRVHPITGKVASDSFIFRKLSDFALEYGQTHGLNYSPQRAENKRRREEGHTTLYRDNKIAEAWAVSDSGGSFIAALKERGFVMAQGDKRLVVVDAYGKIHNPARHIEGIRAKDMKARLEGVDLAALPDAKILAKERGALHEQTKAEKKSRTLKPPALTPDDDASQNKPEPKPEPHSEPEPSVTPMPVTPTQELAPLPAAPQKRDDAEDEYAAQRLNQLQDRHIEERAGRSARLHRQVEHEKMELAKFYRLREQREKIEKLRQKCANPSFWRSVFGLARRDRAVLEIEERNFANARDRYAERVQVLEGKRVEAMDALRAVQKKEWEAAMVLNRTHLSKGTARRTGLTRDTVEEKARDAGYER